MAETNRKKNQIIALSIIGGVVVIGFIVLGTVMNSGPNTAGLPNRSSPTYPAWLWIEDEPLPEIPAKGSEPLSHVVQERNDA